MATACRGPKPRPAPADTLRHFLGTVKDLESMESAMPLEQWDPDVPGAYEQQHWRTVLFAVLLRKYFAKGDDLYLGVVLDALLELGAETCPPAGLARWSRLRDGDVELVDFGEFGVEGGKTYGELDLLRHALYGRYLHGDLEKWQTAMAHSGLEIVALRAAIMTQAHVVEVLAHGIKEWHEQGLLGF